LLPQVFNLKINKVKEKSINVAFSDDDQGCQNANNLINLAAKLSFFVPEDTNTSLPYTTLFQCSTKYA